MHTPEALSDVATCFTRAVSRSASALNATQVPSSAVCERARQHTAAPMKAFMKMVPLLFACVAAGAALAAAAEVGGNRLLLGAA